MSRAHLLPRLFASACLAFFTASAFAAPPSDADIERLLKASRAESMLGAILPQMEAMQQQQFQQLTAGKNLLDKTPALMQNLMLAIQQKIVPMLDELQAELKTVAEEEAKAAPAPAKKKK